MPAGISRSQQSRCSRYKSIIDLKTPHKTIYILNLHNLSFKMSYIKPVFHRLSIFSGQINDFEHVKNWVKKCSKMSKIVIFRGKILRKTFFDPPKPFGITPNCFQMDSGHNSRHFLSFRKNRFFHHFGQAGPTKCPKMAQNGHFGRFSVIFDRKIEILRRKYIKTYNQGSPRPNFGFPGSNPELYTFLRSKWAIFGSKMTKNRDFGHFSWIFE